MSVKTGQAHPILSFCPDEAGRWAIRDRRTDKAFESPLDDAASQGSVDIGYLGRLVRNGQSLLVIAGVHALGSVGVVDYLSRNLDDLYARIGTRRFSMVISSVHADDAVLSAEVVVPPCPHE